MSLKRTIVLLFVMQICMHVYAQHTCNSLFTGQVRNALNEPVPGAAIVLVTKQHGQVSDSLGNFKFDNVCPGKYKVKVQFLGYHEVELDLQIIGNVKRTIYLDEVVTALHEVVIQHHDAMHTEHATNFVQLDEKQLAEAAGKTLGETLRQVSGVNSIQTGPGIFKPVIHGVHSQRILILNHGVRQEGQQWGAEHAPEIDPFIASNVVVIKDASAIKYGTDAIGGVIVVNAPDLPERAGLSGTLNTVLQSNGRAATISGMLEGGVKNWDGWGWRVQGTGKRAGDFHASDYSLTNTGVREMNFSAATGYHKETRGFDIFFSRFQTELGILKGTSVNSQSDLAFAMKSEIPLNTTGFSYTIGEPRQEVNHNLLKLNGHIQNKHGEWRLQYAFQNNHRKEFDQRIGDLSKVPVVNLKLNTHIVEAEWETLHSEQRTISFGVTSMLQNNENVYGTQRIPFIPNYMSLSGGLFGVSKIYRDNWTFDVGARYDYRYYEVKGFDHNNAFYKTSFSFDNVSATLGASARLTKKQSLNLSISAASRPPHVVELLSSGKHQSAASYEYGLLLDTTNDISSLESANFKVENAVKVVASYQRQWRTFSFEVSPYANYIFNYIFLRPEGITQLVSGPFPSFRYTQTDALFVGSDLGLAWQAHRFFKVSSRASLLRASDERNGGFLISIPANRYEVSLRYERPSYSVFRNFYLESKVDYVAKQSRQPRVISSEEIMEAKEAGIDLFKDDQSTFDFKAAPDAYWLLNLATGVSVKRTKVQYDLRIACENSLNYKYREYTNRFRYFADDLGRNIIISFKCIF